ncbi:hypothetical protein RN001_010353 [Aquatica leii]|uniref:Peptidase S1 domain-containing protein n=1 Tax=Aquatica leii TaxID=1421715 RepID=A0AAN7SEE0_9COLE|nr:hypothetical protein RN001_010353 [Aquatica leii]
MFRPIWLCVLVLFVKNLTWSSPGQLENRIVNGSNASIRTFSYHVGIEYNGTYLCGGSIVTPRKIVTASHCLIERPFVNLYKVRGATSIVSTGGLIFDVEEIRQHPLFNNKTYDFDVAVLILAVNLTLGPGIRVIPTQPKGVEIPDGYTCVVTGWGAAYWGGNLTKQLQVVTVPKYNTQRCAGFHDSNVTDNMVCFGYEEGGKDACNGDSGGPLVCNGYLGGIVSWGRECALPQKPGVYTKVSNMVDFIFKD